MNVCTSLGWLDSCHDMELQIQLGCQVACQLRLKYPFKLSWYLYEVIQNSVLTGDVLHVQQYSPPPPRGPNSPLWDMPTDRHFWKRQYWHLLRFFFWILQRRSHLSYSSFRRMVRRKNPLRNGGGKGGLDTHSAKMRRASNNRSCLP